MFLGLWIVKKQSSQVWILGILELWDKEGDLLYYQMT